MNEKPLSFDELEALFQKYEDFENINKVTFMGKVSPSPRKKNVNAKAKRNPNFRSLWDDETDQHIRTARVVLDFPSASGRFVNGKLAASRIGVFTTNPDFVSALREAFGNKETRPTHVLGTGHFQNYRIVSNDSVPDGIAEFFNEVVEKYALTETQEQKLYSLFSLSKGNFEDEGAYHHLLPQNIIWATMMNDAKKEIERLEGLGEPTVRNKVVLQGLVYMPPTFKSGLDIGSKDLIQFKMRVKRFIDNRGTADAPKTDFVPKSFVAEDGYDYFDIVAQDGNLRKWFGDLRQGHPVRVEGALDASAMTRTIKLTYKIRRGIHNLLGGDPGQEFWTRLENLLADKDTRIVKQYPICTVRANDIITTF